MQGSVAVRRNWQALLARTPWRFAFEVQALGGLFSRFLDLADGKSAHDFKIGHTITWYDAPVVPGIQQGHIRLQTPAFRTVREARRNHIRVCCMIAKM